MITAFIDMAGNTLWEGDYESDLCKRDALFRINSIVYRIVTVVYDYSRIVVRCRQEETEE